jgi:hypothetical protein
MKMEINNYSGRPITLKWWHFKLGMKYKCLTKQIRTDVKLRCAAFSAGDLQR